MQQVTAQEASENASTADDSSLNAITEQVHLEHHTTERSRKRKQSKKSLSFGKLETGTPHGKCDDRNKNILGQSTSLPGQLDNCEICGKRFTVTPYSKTGPQGGLLCVKCSKEAVDDQKRSSKVLARPSDRKKRRQTQSNLLDGVVQIGSSSLQQLCIKEIADNIHDIEEFGDLPPAMLNRLSRLLAKKRALTSRTLDLFLRQDLESIELYDCANLDTDDFIRVISVMSRLRSLNLRNAGQFKDRTLDFIMERQLPLEHLQLDAANLVSNEKWIEFFVQHGHKLQTLKLSWLDNSLDDEAFEVLVKSCPNLKSLKLKECTKLGERALQAIAQLHHLESLSLRLHCPIQNDNLSTVIKSVGANMTTLSLEDFIDASDDVLADIGSSCRSLQKFTFTCNDVCTDAGFQALFATLRGSNLKQLNLSANRSLDYSEPDGPELPIGLASGGFEAIIEHFRMTLERLDISSCRHIGYGSFLQAFGQDSQWPNLKEINISFLTKIDATIITAIFISCPKIQKIIAFGCFNVTSIVVPRRVALIGLPNTQEGIVY